MCAGHYWATIDNGGAYTLIDYADDLWPRKDNLSSQHSHWGSEETSSRLLVIGGFTTTYNRPLYTQLGIFTFTFTHNNLYSGSTYMNLSCDLLS